MAGRIKNSELEEFVSNEIRKIRESEIMHKCPYCSSESKILYKVQSYNNNVDVYNYYKCQKCDFIFLGENFFEYYERNYILKSRENNSDVQDDYFSNNANYKNPKYQFFYWSNEKKQISKLGYKSGRILDVGCAAGQFLDQFNDQFEKHGIELSGLSSLARMKNITVYNKPVEDISFDMGYFDVISAYALVEHLENPFSFIEKVTEWLKIGGLLILGTNDINSVLNKYRKEYCSDLTPPEHIILLSYNFYKIFLEQMGYKIIFKKYINGGYTFSNNRIFRFAENAFCKILINKYPFNQLPIYDHFYIYAQKVK